MEKFVKVSDIKKHICELLMLKEISKANEEYCKAIDDRIHAIDKMLEMIPKIDLKV